MSDQLIARLADDLTLVRPGALQRRILAFVLAGAVVAAVVMPLWIGLRPDFPQAFATVPFWVKLGYPVLLAIIGFIALERLARPGATAPPLLSVGPALLVALAAVLGVVQLLTAPPAMTQVLVFGGSAVVCPFYIVALSVPVLIGLLIAFRRLAPTRLTLAGFAAGLLAGGAGAAVYSFHCPETGLPFLALWYTLGMATVAAVGAIAGRWLLRW